jgi:hypothetical protein
VDFHVQPAERAFACVETPDFIHEGSSSNAALQCAIARCVQRYVRDCG